MQTAATRCGGPLGLQCVSSVYAAVMLGCCMVLDGVLPTRNDHRAYGRKWEKKYGMNVKHFLLRATDVYNCTYLVFIFSSSSLHRTIIISNETRTFGSEHLFLLELHNLVFSRKLLAV